MRTARSASTAAVWSRRSPGTTSASPRSAWSSRSRTARSSSSRGATCPRRISPAISISCSIARPRSAIGSARSARSSRTTGRGSGSRSVPRRRGISPSRPLSGARCRPSTAPALCPARPGTAEPDLRAALAAALDARMSAAPPVEPEPEARAAPPPPAEIAPAQDERLAALSGVFGPAEPAAPAAPAVAEAPPPAAEAAGTDRINEWSRMAATMQAEAPALEEKKKGRFGFLKRDEPARAEAASQSATAAPAASEPATGRAGQLASLANAMLGEYNSGQYGKGRLDDRMANLLMRVDEQAEPIDRPLPIIDDRIDAQALDRENVPEEQSVPYLAILVSQIYEDAERTFGKDKAKKGYRASLLQVFGADTSSLSAPDVAGRLPKV